MCKAELIGSGFLNQPRSMSEIMKELQRKGYPFASTTVSPVLLNLVRAGVMARNGERGSYLYFRIQKSTTIEQEIEQHD